MTEKYTNIALGKIDALVKKDNFVGIIEITPQTVHLEFTDDECKVSTLGRVVWSGSEEFNKD